MVAADENLLAIWQIAEPVEEINGFLLGPDHTEIAGMYHHIGLRQIPKPMMAAMSIREMEYLHFAYKLVMLSLTYQLPLIYHLYKFHLSFDNWDDKPKLLFSRQVLHKPKQNLL